MSKPEINVTPLIDVLLVLLIISMVVTPMKPSSFEARVPTEPKNDGVQPNPHTLIVAVTSGSKIRINKDETTVTIDSPDALIERMQNIFREREQNAVTERTVFIKAPQKLDYGSVAKLVDALKQAGANPISLQIDDLD